MEGQPSVILKDLTGREYPAIAEVNRKRRVNGQREISLSFLYTEVNMDFIHDLEFGWEVLFDGEWYIITHPGYSKDGDYLLVEVTAVLSFFVVMNGYYLQDSVEDKSMTAANYFRDLFDGTPYTYVLVDHLPSNTLNYQDNQSRTERFLYGIERFGGEFIIRGRVAYIYEQIGHDKDVILHEDLNVNEVKVDIDASGFHTWAKGYGDLPEDEADGEYRLEVEYVSPLAEKYGMIEGPAIKDGRYKHESELLEAIKEQVENSYIISTEVTAIDLTNNGYPEMKLEEGDRVWLVVDRLNLNQQVRVVEIEETFDWEGNVIDAKYTLGNEAIAESYKSSQYSSVEDFRDIQRGRKKLEYNWLPDAVRRASDIINGNLDSHFIYGPGEIIGINKNNPNGYMRFNTDGIGFSRDGGKTYQTAMTYEGIVADSITTGTLRSILIEAVEIYGSYIEGSTILSKRNDNDFIRLEGSLLVSQGLHDRTWFDDSGNNQVRIMIQNGQIRARNDDKDWSLYFNDWGISTYRDGSGEAFDGDASGYIEFHSTRYHESRGLTIGSGARLALETDGARIYLNTNGPGVHVANVNDVYYSIYAASFTQSSARALKRDIKPLQDDALKVITEQCQIREYKRLTNGQATELDKWQAGLILEEAPLQFVDGIGIDLYTFVAYIARAIQQLNDKVEALEVGRN